MKKIFKVALLMAFVMTATFASAQKSGRINFQSLVMVMPEIAAMQTTLEAFSKDFSDNFETMQVELNNKYVDYQQNRETMTDSIRSLKEKDIDDLNTRMQQFQQSAQQEIQAKQQELLAPIIEKARGAVADVAKESGYAVVYDESAGTLVYFDDAVVVDMLPAVKSRLGIK